MGYFIRFVSILAISVLAQTVRAEGADPGGAIEAEVDGKLIRFAALELDYSVDIDGDIANVVVTQKFVNPTDRPLNARYLFPLRRTAAVHAMTMHVGDEIISAQIQEREVAKQIYTKAKEEGKAASLLDQHRPNMFTQRIANLMPGQPITIEIEYAQIVSKVDGVYQLVVPLVVGPRFQPPGAGLPPDRDASARTGSWTFETLPQNATYGGVHVPDTFTPDRVRLALELTLPIPFAEIVSSTHRLDIRHVSSTHVEARFADGQAQDNRDLVITYRPVADSATAGLLQHWQEGEGGYFSMLIEPPDHVGEEAVIAREMVFLLDCSGSMNGQPMAASKAFMREALQTLRPQDSFRIIRFSDAATEFSASPLAATPENIRRGLQYTMELSASGGTMMSSGIAQALAPPIYGQRIRNVVFLTDGYIGNETSVLELIERNLKGARLFAYGVGAGVNRYLMNELGRVGRGFTRYFDPTRDDENVLKVASELAARLRTPVLRDIEVDWGGLEVSEVFPAELPDLYAGDSLRIVGRFAAPTDGVVEIRGKTASKKAAISLDVDLDGNTQAPSLRQIWARSAVQDKMQAFIAPQERRPDGRSNDELRTLVTGLGLNFNIATRWTSFVAVSKKVYNPDPQTTEDADVTLPRVAGTMSSAYPRSTMTGYAAPEPGIWLMLLVALALLGFKGGFKLVARDAIRT